MNHWFVLLGIGIAAGLIVTLLVILILLQIFRRRAIPEITAADFTAEADVVELFSLSRCDVMDHVEAMQNNPDRFIKKPDIQERDADDKPDYLLCTERCFAIVFERNDVVHNLAVRLSKETAELLAERHQLERASYLSDDDWFNLTIDCSFRNKREVYAIINAAYDYVFTKYGMLNEDAAKAELRHIEQEFSGSAAAELDKVASAAELNYLMALEKFKADYYSDFKITRKEIVEDTRAIDNPDIAILEHAEPQMPVSLKRKGKTYAILYGTDRGVMMVIKLMDSYADKLAAKHPQIRRAKFPAGANWYYVPVDGAFENKESVYTVLNAAYGFVLVKYGTEAEIEQAEKIIYNSIREQVQDDSNYLKTLEDFKASYLADITRHDIIDYSGKLDNPDITIIDRPMEPQLPTSLKFKGKTYAMLYGTESGVVMIMKLDDNYAIELKTKHPRICKARFPAGPNWFYVPVDNKFKDKDSVYTVLSNSISFVQNYIVTKAKTSKSKPKTTAAKEVAATSSKSS